MSYFKDFSEAPPTYRGLLSMLLGAPFWYLSIYLFNAHLYKQDDNLKFVFCFCITILSTLLMFGLNTHNEILNMRINFLKNNTIVEESDVDMGMYAATTKYIISICLQIFVFFTIKHFWNITITYYWHVIISFWLHIYLFISSIISEYKITELEEKQKS